MMKANMPRRRSSTPRPSSGTRDDHLAVAVGVELRPECVDQLLAQLDVVVDLAVEGQQVAAVGVRERLVAQLDIDDRQPLVREDRVQPDRLQAGLVGAPVVYAFEGLGDRAARA
jgi:hypothetical protein